MNNKKSRLAIIVPCYDEELLIKSTVETLLKLLDNLSQKDKISKDSYIYIVDDGSQDKTWEYTEELHRIYGERVRGRKFIRNYGCQKAQIAGLLGAREIGCDCAVSIDADLQQDENAIETFIGEFHKGADIVAGIRIDRKTDSFFKKYSALAFYKFMNILGVKIPASRSDFRLVSKRGLDILSQYNEEGLFLRVFFHEIGLKTTYVKFNVKPRAAGHSKFSFFALMSLALDGITSFSTAPLRIIAILGFLTMIGSFLLALEVFFEKYVLHCTTSGWATLVVLSAFFGGLQIFCIGIIGEYLGKTFQEVKKRPPYIIDKDLG